ncbi:hypothetical protein RvY_01901 [Ramazzottius varieornatus]|uniref:G-protein coupled receptors family 1 profile domain-containing protein n=1 Tax=Ramazzottius varieornatus TaxID=947166 RepID=A0A1D1USK2_RAMVA|nr:hypothetical protein RvY_01901 [Ramazzottius varieornatus]
MDNLTAFTVVNTTLILLIQPSYISPTQYVVALLVSIFFCGTIALNSLFILAVVKNPSLCTSFNVYALNLSIADLLCACFKMTFFAANALHGNWPFSGTYCHFYAYIRMVSFAGAEHALALISLDRMWSVCSPVRYRAFRSVRNSVRVCVGVWFYLHLMLVPYVVMDRVYYSSPDPTVCYFNIQAQKAYSILLSVVVFALPLVTLFVNYSIVQYQVRRRRLTISTELAIPPDNGNVPSKQTRNLRLRDVIKVENQVTVLVVLLLAVGVICWTPVIVHYVMGNVIAGYYNPKFFTTGMMMMYFNCMINPFIYQFRLPSIQNLGGTKKILRSCARRTTFRKGVECHA